MSLPLVNVTARINDQQGRPVGGAVVRMRLTTPEKYQGLIVPRETTGITDANGSAILRVFPNALGYEGSEYDVHVSFPGSNAGVCGSATSIPAVRTIRAHAVVPNADCNLMDIINLPPYEQRGAGAVLATEVAGYAGEAASYADAAKSEADSAAAVKGEVLALEQAAGAAKTAAQASASEAAEYARQAGLSVGEVRDASAHFQSTVTAQVDTTAKRLTADAVTCITERQAVALGAIEERSGDALQDFTTAATQAQTLAVSTVATARENALHDVQDASDTATDSLREMAVEYEEDFLALTERSETAAKKSGCSAAAAAAAESKSTSAADRSEAAAQGLERHRDDALAAANRAEAAEACVKADADRAETAANRCQLNVDVATSSAQSAQKSAQAADASADLAKASADIALSAKIQTTEDRAYVEGVATSTKQAVVDAAATVINDDVIAAATAQATAAVNHARDAAQQALADTQTVKGDAVAAKVAAENARTGAEAARDEANQYALNAKAKADSAAATVANLDTELLAAVPKPIWNGTSLGFKNDSGTVDVPAVDVRGPTGAEGLAATIAVGTVAALEPTEAPLVTNTGTANAAVLNFSIPRGVKGDKGDTGDKGDPGTPALSDAINSDSSMTAATSKAVNIINSGLERLSETVGKIANTTSIKDFSYENRNELRLIVDAKPGDVAVIRGIGLYSFIPDSSEPDDDETAFASQGGVWLLQAASLDAAISYIKPMIDENSWFVVRKIPATVTVVAASTSATIVSDGNVGIEGGEMMFVVPPAGASNKLIFRAYSDYWRRVKIDITNTSASSQSVPSGDISVIVFYIGEQQ